MVRDKGIVGAGRALPPQQPKEDPPAAGAPRERAVPAPRGPAAAPAGPDRSSPFAHFAACLAHELASPLDGSRRFLELALDAETADPQRRAFLLEVRAALARMTDVVKELLALAREDPLRARPVDLRSLLDEADRALRGPDPGRVDCTVPAGFASVPHALFPALTNLLRNALEAAPPPARVAVAARRARRGGILVEVRDRGPGLSPSARRAPFAPLRSTKPGGTGLGLPIAREVAQRLGGRLHLRTRGGRGTTAVLFFPANIPGAAAEAP